MPIIIFNSTNHALLAESVLLEAGIDIDIVPLPKRAPAECGLAIRFKALDRASVESLLAEGRIEYKFFE